MTPDFIIDFFDHNVPDIDLFSGLTEEQVQDLCKRLLKSCSRKIREEAEYLEYHATESELSVRRRMQSRATLLRKYAEIVKQLSIREKPFNTSPIEPVKS